MDEKVVSHAQLHLRFFPGYRLVLVYYITASLWPPLPISIFRCPGPHNCKSETLLKYNKHLDESGHEHPQITAEPEPVTEEAEASSEHVGQISSVLEELSNCIDLDLENGDKYLEKLTDVYAEDEEDFVEETDSLADVLADFFSVPNVSEQNSDQQEQILSCYVE